MTYYKLTHLEFIALSFIFVTFVVGENKDITLHVNEGKDLNLYWDSKPNTCLLYGPDDKAYTHFEPDKLHTCGFIVKDIDISQSGIWVIKNGNAKKKINVHIRESSVTVSVNGAGLSIRKRPLNSNPANKIYFATHYYYEGDTVDVVCFNPAAYNYLDKHYVYLKYSYAYTHDVFKNETFLSYYAVGLRTTLQATHNNSNLKCICTSFDSGRTIISNKVVKVTFLLQNALNVKPVTANFTSEINTTGLSKIMKIQFRSSSSTYIRPETIPLYLNLPANKILINMYAWDTKQLIYYEYEDGDQLSVNCSTSSEVMKIRKIYLNFNGEVSDSAFVTLNKRLSSADDNTILQCFLLENVVGTNEYKMEKKIIVLLQMGSPRKALENITKGSETHDFQSWIIFLVACVVILFMICTSVILYNIKKRNSYKQKKTVDSTNIERDCSNHEIHYAVSNFQKVHQPHNETKNNSKSELTYAVLDLSSPDKASKDVGTERVIYAEIHRNG